MRTPRQGQPSHPPPSLARQPPPALANVPKNATMSDWLRAVTQEGRPYWYNRTTNQTTWTDPATTANVPNANVHANTSAAADQVPAPTTSPSTVTDQSAWREVRTKEGRVYYYNRVTKETQWQRPPEFTTSPKSAEAPAPNSSNAETKSVAAVSTVSAPTGESASNSGHPTALDSQDLPPGWRQHRTSEGRQYFYNATTKQTRWDRPIHTQPKAEAAIADPVHDREAATLHDQQLLKRPNASSATWAEHHTPDGRVYFFNSVTRETSWTRPENINDVTTSPERKRARKSTSPSLTGPAMGQESTFKAETLKPGHAGIVRRPRDAEGKPLTDRASEGYFLKRAEIRRKGRADSTPTVPSFNAEATPQERRAVFDNLLAERGMTGSSSWLEVMARCADDPRYRVVESYGLRKDTWHKFREKRRRTDHRNEIVRARKASEDLIALMDETFKEEKIHVLTLSRCSADKVRAFEADARAKALKERDRSVLIKTYFASRARRGAVELARKRKKLLADINAELQRKIHPSLLPPLRDLNGIRKDDEEVDADEAKMEEDVTMEEKDKDYFNDRTSYRELERFIGGLDVERIASGDDIAEVIHKWRRQVDMLSEQKLIRERELRKKTEKDNRGRFRTGILDMILEGRLSFTARWKEVSETVGKEHFAKSENELGARPIDLFEDGMQLFEKRVERYREEFRQLLKDGDVEVNNNTTVESLGELECMKGFVDGIEKAVVHALLVDRQRKESKRRMKERDRLLGEFDDLLRSSDLSSEVVFEKAEEDWKDMSTYKELMELGAHEIIRRKYDEFMRRRRVKDERKVKRKAEVQADGDGLPGVNPRVKRSRVAMVPRRGSTTNLGGRVVAIAKEEENGWDAVVSEKVTMTEEEKTAEKERRKREILQAHELKTSVTNSHT